MDEGVLRFLDDPDRSLGWINGRSQHDFSDGKFPPTFPSRWLGRKGLDLDLVFQRHSCRPLHYTPINGWLRGTCTPTKTFRESRAAITLGTKRGPIFTESRRTWCYVSYAGSKSAKLKLFLGEGLVHRDSEGAKPKPQQKPIVEHSGCAGHP